MASPDKRGFVAGKFALEIDGVNGGWCKDVTGGNAKAEVVTEKMGPDHIAKKHLAGVTYEDIKITCGTGMSKGFYNWIKDSFDHKYTRKNGAIIAADYNYKEMSRMTFTNALITEVGFPALDASSKDQASMSLSWHPEITRTTTSPANTIFNSLKNDQAIQKKWLPSNFRLKIDGLDCTRVTKIDAITVKQKVISNAVGEMRDFEQEPASVEIPNLVITLAESHSDAFYKWHEDFVIKGNNGDDKEKGGTLEFLTPSLAETLFTISFDHLGIFNMTPDKVEAGSEAIRRVKCEMYCEDMKFDYKAAWA